MRRNHGRNTVELKNVNEPKNGAKRIPTKPTYIPNKPKAKAPICKGAFNDFITKSRSPSVDHFTLHTPFLSPFPFQLCHSLGRSSPMSAGEGEADECSVLVKDMMTELH